MSSEILATSKGKIKGKVVEVKNAKAVHVYRKIPFAKPPVGKLRFMPPQPADPWDGVKDGTTVGDMPMCMSGYATMLEKALPLPHPTDPVKTSEDCLHVTVYTPCPVKGKKLPVMVWFYGGAFAMGAERDYDGSAFSAMNDVVVAIPNYRVGIFGFFSLGKNSICTGNAGIMDQQLALKWIQENIEIFGGNKDNVTIFGESAGAISVHLNIVSPLSRGLFHKAISLSGQISMPELYNDAEKNNDVKNMTLKHFKIEETDDLKIVEAVQKIPAEELISIQMVHEQSKVQFSPMVDGKVFEKATKHYIADEEFSKVPYIVGCNSTEGAGNFGIFLSPDFEKGIGEDMAKMMLPFRPLPQQVSRRSSICMLTIPMQNDVHLRAVSYLMHQFQKFELSDEGWEKCKEFYEINKLGDEKFSKLLAYVFGDAAFVTPASIAADAHAASGATVYKYVGNFTLKMFHDVEYGNDVMKKPSWCICDHGDDVMITLGQPFSPYPMLNGAKYSKEEEELCRKWMTYLTNFAKTGDPNLGEKVETKWPRYEPGGHQLLVDHKMSTTKGFRAKEVKFWRENMPSHMIPY